MEAHLQSFMLEATVLDRSHLVFQPGSKEDPGCFARTDRNSRQYGQVLPLFLFQVY